MNVIPKLDLGSADPELKDFCAYFAKHRYELPRSQGCELLFF